MSDPLTAAADEQLDATITGLLKARFGADAEIVASEGLSARISIVRRLHLRGGEVPPSIVAKHPRDAIIPRDATSAEFAEELLAYRFLTILSADEGLTPKLIDYRDRDLMLLEDLGADGHHAPRGFAELIPRIAFALSRLHGRTLGREPEYLKLRADSGYPPPLADERHHGPGADARRVAFGMSGLLQLATGAISTASLGALASELETCRALVRDHDGPKALVHGDLANARQTVEIDGALRLLDFENAHFALPMCDLAKPMLGKFEIEADSGFYVWVSPRMPLALADRYRALMASDFGMILSDERWREALAASLIESALALLGNLAMVGERRPRRAPIGAYINAVLDRLAELLQDWCPFRTILAVTTNVRAQARW